MRKTVVHFEIGCSDLEKTASFYRDIFDWNLEQHGNSMAIDTGASDALPGHINKLGPEDPQKYVTVYIETDTLTEDLEAVESHGGKVFVPPTKLAGDRTFAWFEDVAGNLIGLITPKKS